MYYLTINLKNGYSYYGFLSKNRENSVSLGGGTWETSINGESVLLDDPIEFSLDDIESAIGEKDIVGVDYEGNAIIEERPDLLKQWRRKL